MNLTKLLIAQAGVYAVFWVIFSLYSLRNIGQSYEERREDGDETIEDYASTTKIFSVSFLQGLCIAIWLFMLVIDILGFVLLFNFAGTDNWTVKILTIIAALGLAHGFREMISTVQALGDKQKLKAIFDNMKPITMRMIDIAKLARLAASLLLVAKIMF